MISTEQFLEHCKFLPYFLAQVASLLEEMWENVFFIV